MNKRAITASFQNLARFYSALAKYSTTTSPFAHCYVSILDALQFTPIDVLYWWITRLLTYYLDCLRRAGYGLTSG